VMYRPIFKFAGLVRKTCAYVGAAGRVSSNGKAQNRGNSAIYRRMQCFAVARRGRQGYNPCPGLVTSGALTGERDGRNTLRHSALREST